MIKIGYGGLNLNEEFYKTAKYIAKKALLVAGTIVNRKGTLVKDKQ
ncbi:hypothetical protein [Stygiolobus caldivivus]|nr:hypothetical protein [Stygiolobus caldivivus]